MNRIASDRRPIRRRAGTDRTESGEVHDPVIEVGELGDPRGRAQLFALQQPYGA